MFTYVLLAESQRTGADTVLQADVLKWLGNRPWVHGYRPIMRSRQEIGLRPTYYIVEN